MAVKIYKCSECDWTGKKIEKPEMNCPECKRPLEVDVIATMKGANFDRVPGGYESIKLNNERRSLHGQELETAYLAGTSREAY